MRSIRLRQRNTREPVGRNARVVLAGPHELVLEALEHLLERSGLDVVGRCARPADLDRCLASYAPDVALVDADFADVGDVPALIEEVRRGLGSGLLVLLAPHLDPALARDSLALEVDGVLLKCASSSDVVAGLLRILAGDTVFPAGWLAAAHRAVEPGLDALSERQREVLELLAQGLPNELIAKRLFISRNTVKFHVAAIYERLGVHNRVQAAHALAGLRDAS
jgi:DNA-binding NarL/FixJ family response regulator